ncbi:MAG: diguanylate cyclase [Deltaproteobacteria bacterium]|nr:diguanylate cyclase [Deltaproteobacteria bacterium]
MGGKGDTRGERAIIIDGDKSSTSFLSALMDRLDLKRGTACDLEQALPDIENGSVSLVVADVSLVEPEQVKEIQDLHPDICFIFTGRSLERFRDWPNPGLSDFLAKPFISEEVEFRLKRIFLERKARLKNQKARRALETARVELEKKKRQLEMSEEDLEKIKHLYKEIGNELNTTSEKLRKAKDQLEVLAVTDGLTEVYNHRYFMDQIHEKFEEARKRSSPLSLLMIDIDHFKAFNDTHGHLTGDLVLKNIAQVLKSNCRKTDIVARYGGEEFAVIMPNTDFRRAQTAAQRIRNAVESRPLPNGRKIERVTVSIGIGITEKNVESADTLISMADKALYRAKSEGRNRVVLREENQPAAETRWYSRF